MRIKFPAWLATVCNNASFALLLSGLSSFGVLVCTLILFGNVYDPTPWLYGILDGLAVAGYIVALALSIACWRRQHCWIRTALTILIPLFALLLLAVSLGSVPLG